MAFHVRLSGSAHAELGDIVDWIAARSPAGAAAWYDRWRQALRTLEQRAQELALAPESQGLDKKIQQLVFHTKRGRPYRALFEIRKDIVFVLHIRGPGQDTLRPDELE